MSQQNRAQTMAVKLDAYARRAGVQPDPLIRAYEIAVERRIAALRDVFHPDTLHPARNILILLEDAACTDAEVLTAASLTETEFPEMRVEVAEARETFGDDVAHLIEAVPVPARAQDELAEQLVTAADDVVLIAIAERLDHARHLHFRDAAVWRPFHEQICDIYLPVAARTQERLAERLERWATSFEKRFLG